MNNDAHACTTRAAIGALPRWEQAIWAPELKNLAEVYSLFGDTYPLDKAGIGPYIEFPDGTLPDFYMTRFRQKKHIDSAIDFWEFPFYDSAVRTFVHFTDSIIASLRAGDITRAACFAGTVAHYIQDNACPGHAVDATDLEGVKDFFPPPEPLRLLPFHAMMETRPDTFSLPAYHPKLYGLSVAQAASNFVDRFVGMVRFSRRQVLPFLESIYTHDTGRAAGLNAEICRFAAEVYADWLHTAACLAGNRFSEEEQAALSERRLSSMHPYRLTAWAPSPYDQLGPGDLAGFNVDTSFNPVPCSLIVQTPERGKAIATLSDAMGSTAYFERVFSLPSGVYRRFCTDYGVHATLGADHPIVFEVWNDDVRLFRDVRLAGEEAGRVSIDWPAGATRLRLITTIASDVAVQRINDRPLRCVGHAVWGHPRLCT